MSTQGLTGRKYADRVARYLVHNYGRRGIEVYREVPLGKTIIGKDRRVDILVLEPATRRALCIECKFQDVLGTTDEKIPYALDDLAAMHVPAFLCYAGEGFSPGIRHMLAASRRAAACMPNEVLEPDDDTRELDHVLATTFGWWDLVVRGRVPLEIAAPVPTPTPPAPALEPRPAGRGEGTAPLQPGLPFGGEPAEPA